jgi:hypothetical protein
LTAYKLQKLEIWGKARKAIKSGIPHVN